MRICIVGGGKVGYYLAKTLIEHGHHPVVIEQDMDTSTRVANALDISVIHGDGASIDSLRAAQAERCQACVCVSGKDEVNLVAAQLAKTLFRVKKTVVRVNNPKNTAALKRLGVDIVVSGTQNIARLLERQVETSAMRHLMELGHGSASLVEVMVPTNFRYNDETLTTIPIPKGLVIISVTRRDSFIIPNGETKILSGDTIMVAATDAALHQLIAKWQIEEN